MLKALRVVHGGVLLLNAGLIPYAVPNLKRHDGKNSNSYKRTRSSG